ncbi:hypothetical protein ACI65C_013672 [Semiaphis heraclei]
MDKIETTSNQTTTINQAGALRRMLLDSTFIYWLNKERDNLDEVDDGESCVDTIIVSVKELYKYKGHLIAAKLFLLDNFEKNFPQLYLEQTVEAYPFIDKFKLKTELQKEELN